MSTEKFKSELMSILEHSGIISLKTIRRLVVKYRVPDYIDIVKQLNLKKSFIIECPICHNEIGNESDYEMGEEIKCPFGEHCFVLDKSDIRLYLFNS